jgi:hypothetical protein
MRLEQLSSLVSSTQRALMSASRSLILPLALSLAPCYVSSGAAAGAMDCVIMQRGGPMIRKEAGPMEPVRRQMKLSDGSRLMPDGTVWKPGGAKMHLKEGEMIMMDGHVMTGSKAKAMQK